MQVGAYMMAAALKALMMLETKFLSDGRTFLTGDEFTAAGMPSSASTAVSPTLLPCQLTIDAWSGRLLIGLHHDHHPRQRHHRASDATRVLVVIWYPCQSLMQPAICRADIVGGQCITVARLLGFLTEKDHPKTSAYLDRLTKRPAYVKIFGSQV